MHCTRVYHAALALAYQHQYSLRLTVDGVHTDCSLARLLESAEWVWMAWAQS